MAIDIEALCAPIDGDSPVGRDLIAAPLSDKEPMKSWAELDTELDEAVTNEAELMLPSDPAARRPKSPDWSQLADRLKTTLTKHSKDLRLSSRLTGVLTRTSGFEGLRDGLKLSRALCSRYWDSIHPQPTSEDDPDDADPRGLALVRDLSRIKLGTAIQQIPLVVGKSGAQYRFADYLMAAQGHNPNADSIDTIAAAGAKTDPQHFRKLLSDLDAALAELEQLDSELYERCGVSEKTGSRATSWTEWKETIKQYQSAVRIVGAHAFEQPAESDPPVEEEDAPAASGGTVTIRGPIASRATAFRQLSEIAKFFEKTEPHSPLSSALRELERWEKLSFADLMMRLLEDEAALKKLFVRTGVEPKPKDGEGGSS